ncbi:MAG: cell wall hydrolase [Rhizobiales bacterium]|nr:cell wall hydrolase [Hyphomicrobiales bacterium]MBI3674667.1 cell wall hydrolase [Hyphomicrobiales bacterium]
MLFGGVMLVLAFAFAGHYMGDNAVARGATPEDTLDIAVAPTTNIAAKGSLLPGGITFDIVNADVLRLKGLSDLPVETVVASGKDDLTVEQPGVAVKIVPAAVDLTEKPVESTVKRLNLTPSTAKIEQSFKLKHGDQLKVIAQRRLQQAEENCLARAIYFEARSETELGQLAVAKVILNRTKDPNYPKTICGVVYQGSGIRNSCQFSFACDGLPDDVKSPTAWANSKAIAQKAMAGDQSVAAIGNATNYHADYVNPRWARTMKRLIKIGHHIFYAAS